MSGRTGEGSEGSRCAPPTSDLSKAPGREAWGNALTFFSVLANFLPYIIRGNRDIRDVKRCRQMENDDVGCAHMGSRGKGIFLSRVQLSLGWTPAEAKINGFIEFNLYE